MNNHLKIKTLFSKFFRSGYSLIGLSENLGISVKRLEEIRSYPHIRSKCKEIPEYPDLVIFYQTKIK